MVATVSIGGTVGLTNISSVDTLTGLGVVKIEGSGGTPSLSLTTGSTDVNIQNSEAAEITVNKTRILVHYNYTAGIDFTSGSTGSGTLKIPDGNIYMWGRMMADGALNTKATGGIQLMAGNSPTTNYKVWNVEGAGYGGNFKKFAISPRLASTTGEEVGSPDIGNVTYLGIIADVGATTSRFINFIIDRIDVGNGLTVTGTSSTTWDDILLADEGTSANRYGIVRSDNGIIYCQGKIQFGDGGTSATALSDTNSKIVFENPTYYNGTSDVSCFDSGFYELIANGGATDTLQFGTKIGSGNDAVGSGGINISSAGPATIIDFNGHGMASVKMYGNTFGDLGTIALDNTAATTDEFTGNIVSGCDQVSIFRTLCRNNTISGYTGSLSAILWDDNSDFAYNNLLNNQYGIEHDVVTGAPYDYTKLIFTGNTTDVNNTSASAFTINKLVGSNPSTYAGSVVTFSATFSLSMTNLILGTQLTLVNSSTRTELQNTIVGASGIVAYSHSGGETIDILPIHQDYDPLLSSIYSLTLDNADQSIKFAQLDDNNYVA